MARANTVKKGRLLEDEVAEIYRNVDGVKKVVQNWNIMGIQVDVYVEIEGIDGGLIRYAIDTKNYSANVSAEEARKCVNDFFTLRNSNRIDKGIIVAATGFTQDANATVIESGYTPLLIADLRKKALDFSPYLNAWIRNYENELQEQSNMVKYISLTARRIDTTNVGNLDKYLQNWLSKSGRHITLLGNYGTGKSTTLRYLMYTQAKKYLDNPDNERIPIFIELKGFRQAPKSKQLITDILVNDFGLNINYRKFLDFNERGKLLIILDGFDEMADRVLDGLPQEHFEELSVFACDNGKVILSSRTHYFRDHEQLLEVHSQDGDLLSQVELRKDFEILFLNSFTEKNINEILQASFIDKWLEYKEIIRKTYDLYSLAEVPILLNMIVRALPEMIKRGLQINRPAIYEVFTEKWLQRDNWRRSLHKTERLYFCKQLALYFYTSQNNSVHWRDLPRFIKEYLKGRVNSQTDLDIFDFDIRTSNFLNRKEDSGHYSFVHKSFMEYFAARQFHENIQMRVVNGLDLLKDYVKSRVIYEFLIDMLEKKDTEVILSDIIKGGKEKVTNRIYNNPESLGNCAYLLAAKGYQLDYTVLEFALLSGFVLNNASFKDTILVGADFRKCKLKNIDFCGATLSLSKFEGAELKNINFEGAILDKVDFRDALIDNETIASIAKAQYWATGKFSGDARKKIESAYKKPSDVIIYNFDKD